MYAPTIELIWQLLMYLAGFSTRAQKEGLKMKLRLAKFSWLKSFTRY